MHDLLVVYISHTIGIGLTSHAHVANINMQKPKLGKTYPRL